MDVETPTASLRLSKEVRCDSTPPSGSVIQIQVTPPGAFSVRARQYRRVLHDDLVFKSQEAFKNHYSASEISIFRSKSLPEKLQWRVIHGSRIVELRPLDLCQGEEEESEARLTIQLCFSANIRHGGVAIAEADDAFDVFVVTRSNELYTMHLPGAFFCNETASEADPTNWCKVAKPASFGVSAPQKIIARDVAQLLVSLCDGRLLKLTRAADDGSKWDETMYTDGQWASSLRGLVKWQQSNTVRYGGNNLDPNTALAILVSPDGHHIVTLCLNHTLRVWNTDKHTLVASQDLLGRDREGEERKPLLDPHGPNVILGLKTTKRGCAVMTFSPLEGGQFKFWAVDGHGLRDLFPNDVLRVPDPDSSSDSKNVWKLVDFAIRENQNNIDFWVLVRSNRLYMMYNLTSDLTHLSKHWPRQWIEVVARHEGSSPTITANLVESWSNAILQSGAFPTYVVESALQTYCADRGIQTKARDSLAKQMQDAVAHSSRAQKAKAYDGAHAEQWRLLWQDVRDFDRTRSTAMSIVASDEMWVLFSDACSIVRSCSRLEQIAHNDPEVLAMSESQLEMPSVEMEGEPKHPDEMATVIKVAASLRSTFTAAMRQKFAAAVQNALDASPNKDPIQTFFDQSGLDEIDDRVFDDVTNVAFDSMDGLGNLDTDVFMSILQTFYHLLPDLSSEFTYTAYGLKTVINGARDMIDQRLAVLLDLLALAVFVEMEVDREKTPMEYFDAIPIFKALLYRIRQTKLLQWLVSHERGSATLLQTCFAVDLRPRSVQEQGAAAWTHSIQDLLQWVLGGNDDVPWADIPVHIMCDLLKHGEVDLATKFLVFLPKSAWADYIRGRLALATGDNVKAAEYFKGATDLAQPSDMAYHHASRGLLSSMDAQYFGHGLSVYYTHILHLLTASQAYIQATEFAEMALEHSDAKSEQTTDLLNSLFTCSIKTAKFSTAYTALNKLPNSQELLPTLVLAIIASQKALKHLLSVPWDAQYIPKIDEMLSASNADPRTIAAWRIEHSNDFRGAAAALLPALSAKQAKARRGASFMSSSAQAADLQNDYLTVINLLACAGEEDAWVLSGGGKNRTAGATQIGKRRIVTLEDVRQSYQDELDRRSMLEGGRFAYTAAAAPQADGDGDVDMLL